MYFCNLIISLFDGNGPRELGPSSTPPGLQWLVCQKPNIDQVHKSRWDSLGRHDLK